MRCRLILSLLSFALLLGGCVTNKKVLYLQKDDVNRKDLPVDTLVRSYTLQLQDYRVRPQDILYINFETLTAEEFDFFTKINPPARASGGAGQVSPLAGIVVDSNGEIEFPVLGKIKVEGKSLFEVQHELQALASQYLKDVVIRVRLMNFRFTVLGEVIGEQTTGSGNTRLTMMEAIGLTGGFTDLADRTHVKLIRQVGDKANVYYLNLLDEELVTSPLWYVQQNDVIIVPPLRQRAFRRYFAQNITIFLSAVGVVLLFINVTK